MFTICKYLSSSFSMHIVHALSLPDYCFSDTTLSCNSQQLNTVWTPYSDIRGSLFRLIFCSFSLCPDSCLSLSKPWASPLHTFKAISQLSSLSPNWIYSARLRNSDLLISHLASLMTLKDSWRFLPNVFWSLTLPSGCLSFPPLRSHWP